MTTIVHGTVRDYQLEEGQKALRAACELLNQFDVEYTKHILIGHAADVITECAKELHCQKVIMSTRGFGIVLQLLLGSVSRKVIHQIYPQIPVTLVKAGYPVSPGMTFTTLTRSNDI